VWRDCDGLADHGRGAGARRGGSAGRAQPGRAARRPAGAGASRHRDGAARRSRSRKVLLRSAAHAFGPKEAVARARCVVAEAEIALVSRDLGWPAKALDAARVTLEVHGDRVTPPMRVISRSDASC